MRFPKWLAVFASLSILADIAAHEETNSAPLHRTALWSLFALSVVVTVMLWLVDRNKRRRKAREADADGGVETCATYWATIGAICALAGVGMQTWFLAGVFLFFPGVLMTAPFGAWPLDSNGVVDVTDLWSFVTALTWAVGSNTLACGLFGGVIGAIRRSWRSQKRFGPHQCGACGYNLTGNVSGRCPECGSER